MGNHLWIGFKSIINIILFVHAIIFFLSYRKTFVLWMFILKTSFVSMCCFQKFYYLHKIWILYTNLCRFRNGIISRDAIIIFKKYRLKKNLETLLNWLNDKRLYVHDTYEKSTFQAMEAKKFKLYPTLLIWWYHEHDKRSECGLNNRSLINTLGLIETCELALIKM